MPLILLDLRPAQVSLRAPPLIHIVVLDLSSTFEDGFETLLVLCKRLLVLSLEPFEEVMRLVASCLNRVVDSVLFGLQRGQHLVIDLL